MAYEVGNHAISVPASADLSAKQFLFGTIDASGQVAVTGAAVAAGALLEADAAGKAVTQAAGKIVAKALAAGSGDGAIIPALLILQR